MRSLLALLAGLALAVYGHAASAAEATYSVVLPGGCSTATYQGGTQPDTQNTSGQKCVAASVSASIAGFTPNNSFATLTATGSSASVALPTNTGTVQFQNDGTTEVSCALGTGSATAVANELLVPAQGKRSFSVGTFNWGACIDQAGSASNLVVLAGGSGLGNDTGGGSSGGSGGAVNLNEVGGTSYALGASVSASSMPVVIASDQAAVAVKMNATPSLANGNGTVPTQGGSVLSATNGLYANLLQGNAVLSSGNPIFAQLTTGSVTIGAVTAPGAAALATAANQVTTPATGNGVTNSSTQRVTISSDSTGQVTLASGTTVATAQSGVTSTQTGFTITAGGTFQSLAASSGTRKGCLVVNPVTATENLLVFFGATGSATTSNSIPLAPGAAASCTSGGIVLQDNIAATGATTSHAGMLVLN